MLQVFIAGLSQDVSFESDDASTRTYALLQLPDGTRIRALIDEADVSKIVQLRAGGSTSGPLPPPAEYEYEPIDDIGAPPVAPGVHVFGGEDDTPAEPAAPLPIQAQVTRSGKLVMPSRTVPKNDMGYPIMNGGVAMEDVVGGYNQDEDGVGSV